MKKYLLTLLLSIFLFLQSNFLQAQCAMCRSSLESNVSDGNVTVSAYLNFGIMYLFVTPYILFIVLAFFWYRASKKNGKPFMPSTYFKS